MPEGQDRYDRQRETIFALATPPGRGALAVVRISGPDAFSALVALGGGDPKPRELVLRRLVCPNTEEVIDEALVVRFRDGSSFTGESSVELHLHGGRAVVARILRVLGGLTGFRIAEPGEFTRRALAAGRIDLAQAESLADLVNAETEMQRRQALALLTGELSRAVAGWRQRLLTVYSMLEANLDFSDEGDVSFEVVAIQKAELQRLAAEIGAVSAGRSFGRGMREGFTIAVVGPPNAGKSSLFNYLAGHDAAIVSAVPGTTRDVIRVSIEVDGLPVWLVDTAGMRETSDEVEAIGVARARKAAKEADLRLFVEAIDARLSEEDRNLRPGDIRVWLKSDLGFGPGDVLFSVKNGAGVDELLDLIAARLRLRAPAGALAATERQALRLHDAANSLVDANREISLEIAVEHVRHAMRSLDQLIGRVDVEEILDEVFSRFCIGK